MKVITVQTTVKAPLAKVWNCWNEPEHIPGWAFASDDWQAQALHNELRVGGTFKNYLSAKNGSFGFDFAGTYTEIVAQERIAFAMTDGRRVTIEFVKVADGINVIESFEPESENPAEIQRAGWQAFLDNFKKYVEAI